MNALICCLVLLGSRVHGDVLGGIDTHIGGSISLWVSNEFWSCGSVFGGIFSHVSGAVGRSIFGSIDLKVSWEVGGPVFWPCGSISGKVKSGVAGKVGGFAEIGSDVRSAGSVGADIASNLGDRLNVVLGSNVSLNSSSKVSISGKDRGLLSLSLGGNLSLLLNLLLSLGQSSGGCVIEAHLLDRSVLGDVRSSVG